MAAEPASGSDQGSQAPRGVDARWSAIAATLALGLLGGTFVWWALKFGAYFGTVMYPGVALLAIGIVILIATTPWRASLILSGAARLALICLMALAGWSLASALWSPTPDIAVEDAQRMVGYALAFGLGIWASALLRHRMELAMLTVAGASGIVALVTLVALAIAATPLPYLDGDGTLQYPLGYRNANAAFFCVALWPSLALASSPRLGTVVRIGGLVSAVACVELAILAQSRGSILGVAAGFLVYVLAAQHRLKALVWLALAVLPAAFSIFDAVALFDAAKENSTLKGTVDELNNSGTSGLARLGIAAILGLVALRLEPHVRLPASLTTKWLRRTTAAVIVAAAIVATVAVIGNPVTWAGDRLTEFAAGEPDLSRESSRFTLNAGTGRSEVWGVALEAVSEDPIFGEGGGGFQFRYNRDRDNPDQLARDAHSVWLEMASELGLVGLVLFAVAIGGAFTGAIRARRLGPAAAQLSCGALAAGACWLAHASVDWFWPFPAVTASALALLGAAAAPILLERNAKKGRAGRRVLLVATVAFAITLIPPFISERLVERSLDTFRASEEQAYEDLALARDLNPLSDVPALTEGSIALALDDSKRAITAFREAVRMRPEEYVGHFFLALLLAREDPDQARTELAEVTELNRFEVRLDELSRRIEAAERRQGRGSQP